ncbi:MAG: HIT family protein, partial [Candidatus Aenigmarchaeota archaeon]|nr:HIT family protein [Candidatus Aenigmarchaeota archaeon]
MQQCPFCKIASKQSEADIIYEDDHSLAFLDANPSAPGHALLIPKEHVPDIQTIDDELLCNFFKALKRVTSMIKEALDPDGFTIGINQGQCAGARVPHLHIHIIPRFNDDKGAMIQLVVKNPPHESLASIKEKIKSCAPEEIPEHILNQIQEEQPQEKEIEKVEEELEKCEEKELEKKEKEYKGKKDIKDKEEEELERYEKILRKMRIPR